jgi:hypothetical protein
MVADDDAPSDWRGRIVDDVDLGTSRLLTIALDGIELQVRADVRAAPPTGGECRISMSASAISVWAE